MNFDFVDFALLSAAAAILASLPRMSRLAD
jgi:hypothetical protein